MATAWKPQPLTFDEFVRLYEPLPDKYELVDGVAVMMAGSNNRHAFIASRILISLGRQLRGSGCVPVGSDAMLRLDEGNGRLPDVGIYCDPRDLETVNSEVTGLRFPRVLFEVLSPSTQREDRGAKVPRYQEIATLDTIVLVDPAARVFETYERLGPAQWRFTRQLPDADLILRDPAVTLSAAEVFDG